MNPLSSCLVARVQTGAAASFALAVDAGIQVAPADHWGRWRTHQPAGGRPLRDVANRRRVRSQDL